MTMAAELNLEFVHVPGGEFIMGSDPRVYRACGADEVPQHSLIVTAFHIMRFPVTNAQFLLFMKSTGHRAPLGWQDGMYKPNHGDHPVVGVTLPDALRFCAWAAQTTGLPLRLPTEPEWEKAARGVDGRLYPWGNAWDPALAASRENPANDTSPVSAHSPKGDSPYGMADAAGNVSEWCSTTFGPYPYDPNDGREAQVYNLELASLFPAQHDAGAISNPERSEANLGKQCIRGGSWRGTRDEARCSYRSWAAPLHRSDDTGFRCCYE